MKKFIVAIILIIPIVVVFSLFSTSYVIAETINVNATSIAVFDENNQQIKSDIELDILQDSYMIYVEVLPTLSYDKSVSYNLDTTISTGSVLLEETEDNYFKVIPQKVGVARLIIYANSDHSIHTVLTVVVTSKALQDVVIYDNFGHSINNTLSLQQPMQLGADFYPISALSNGVAVWHSTDNDVATVSPNGLVTPVSQGETTISVHTVDLLGKPVGKSFKVDTSKALVNTNIVYSSTAVDVQYIKDNVVIDSSATVAKNGNNFIVSSDNCTADVEVECNPNAGWGFVEQVSEIYLNHTKYAPIIKVWDTKLTKTYSLSIRNITGIASIVGGYICPQSTGTIAIVATLNGEQKELVIEILERPHYIELPLNQEDQALGIEQSHVFGNTFFNEDKLTNTFNFAVANNANYSVKYQSSNPTVATIDEQGLVTILGSGKFTITATVMLGEYKTSTTAKFTFEILEQSAINVANLSQFLQAQQTEQDVVLQDNIYLTNAITLNNTVYGNGHKISTEKAQGVTRYARMISIVSDKQTPITLQNLVVEGSASYSESENKGLGIYIKTKNTPVNFNYCIVRYFNDGIEINSGSDVNLKGCVLGNCHFLGMQINNDYNYNGTITLENIIFKESNGPSILMMNETMQSEGYSKNIVPTIKISGFFESYNWKTTPEIKAMLSEINLGLLSMIEDFIDTKSLMQFLGLIVEEVFLREDMAHLSYIAEDGTRYVSAGMVAIGVYNFIDTNQITIKDKGVTLLEIPMPNDKSEIGVYLKLAELGAKLVDPNMSVMNSSYMLSYNIEDNNPRCKPNQPVPEDAELYARLTAK